MLQHHSYSAIGLDRPAGSQVRQNARAVFLPEAGALTRELGRLHEKNGEGGYPPKTLQ